MADPAFKIPQNLKVILKVSLLEQATTAADIVSRTENILSLKNHSLTLTFFFLARICLLHIFLLDNNMHFPFCVDVCQKNRLE